MLDRHTGHVKCIEQDLFLLRAVETVNAIGAIDAIRLGGVVTRWHI